MFLTKLKGASSAASSWPDFATKGIVGLYNVLLKAALRVMMGKERGECGVGGEGEMVFLRQTHESNWGSPLQSSEVNCWVSWNWRRTANWGGDFASGKVRER